MTENPGGLTPMSPVPEGEGRKSRIRAGRLWTGIGEALAGHLLTILIGWGMALASPDEAASTFLVIAGIGQVLLAILALGIGITLTVKGNDGGLGVGIIIGWAVGLIISPIVGFGVCVSLIKESGTFG
jgi:hypothetical protein